MDATQLTLLLTSRTQAANKLILRTEDEAANADKAFGAMLQKHIEERADEQKRLETERQNWRNQPASTPSSARVATPVSSRAATSSSTPTHAEDHAEKVTQRPAAAKDAAATKDSNQTVAHKGATQSDKTDSKTATKSDTAKPDDDDSTSDGKEAAAAGSVSVTKVEDNTAQAMKDGDAPADGGGKNQDGQGKEDKAKQGTDESDGQVAGTEGVGAIVLATTVPLQPVVPLGGAQSAGGIGTVGQPAIGQPATGLPALGQPATDQNSQSATTGGSLPIAGGQTSTTANTTAGTIAAAAAAAAAASTGQDPAASTSAAAQIADMSAADGTLPAAFPGLSSTGTDPLSGDTDTSFASIVAKKDNIGSSDGQGLRINITRQNQDQPLPMPKPLVRVDDSRSATQAAQPTISSTPTATVSPATEEDLGTTAVASDYQSDDADLLHGFGSFSSLLTGSGPIGSAKQADILTNLRQQLASASVQDQVAIHLQRAVRDSVDKISIQLSPEELGHIHVKMNVDDDKQVSATISVERPATLELLQRDTKALERALQEAGLKADSGSLSFSLQRGNQGDSSDTPGWGQNGRQVGSSGQEKTAAATEVSSGTAGNEIDTANGLVNVAV